MQELEPQRGGCLAFFLIAILLSNGYSALSSAGEPLILALAVALIIFAGAPTDTAW